MSEDGGQNSIRAKFDLANGPSTPSSVAVQFVSEGTNLSGVDFELTGFGYRVSLVKKRIITGTWSCKGNVVLIVKESRASSIFSTWWLMQMH